MTFICPLFLILQLSGEININYYRLEQHRSSHQVESSTNFSTMDDEKRQNQTHTTTVTDAESQDRISNPSLVVTSQGPMSYLCYFCIFFVPIAITTVSLVLYNYSSISNTLRYE